jgi:hypothetical protein
MAKVKPVVELKCSVCGHRLQVWCPACRGRRGGSRRTPAQLKGLVKGRTRPRT